MCNVLPGDKSQTQESLKALIYGTDIYLSPMHASSEVAQKIFSSLRPYKLNIPEASRDRRLGTAIEVAPAIIQGPSTEMSRGVVKRAGDNNRIIVCTGGPNTNVPGLAPFSSVPSLSSRMLSVLIHILPSISKKNEKCYDILNDIRASTQQSLP
uniref:Protein transport protein SEC23 n=1 Tax=Solanum lycopersicum TaxID=4081 RepID=A0A3Q7IXI1_SOLLC